MNVQVEPRPVALPAATLSIGHFTSAGWLDVVAVNVTLVTDGLVIGGLDVAPVLGRAS